MSREERAHWPFKVVRLGEEPKALFYWLSRSVDERVAELMRIRKEHFRLLESPPGPFEYKFEIRYGRNQ